MRRALLLGGLCGTLVTACSSGGGGGSGQPDDDGGGGRGGTGGSTVADSSSPPPPDDATRPPIGGDSGATSLAAKLAIHLRGKPNFMIGMGNDLANNHDQDGAYTLGTTLDLHYAYLVGLQGQGGWPDWNAGGTFVNILTDSAAKH